MNQPLVSVIILNYNGKNYIKQCVESVLKSDYNNIELIIVDNNSTDESMHIIERTFNDSRINIIRSNENLGFAGGNNLGAQFAKGEYIFLLNIDVIVDTKWLTELVSLMQSDKTIGVAQPKILTLDDKTVYDSAGDYIDYFGVCFRRGGSWQEKDCGQYDTIHDIFSARGAAFITRKEIIENIGLFDEDFFMYFEDVDFCWRTRLYGKRIVFVPRSIVYHKMGGTTTHSIDAGIVFIYSKHSFKNQFSVMIKNYDGLHVIKYSFLYLIAYIITGSFLLEPFIYKINGSKLVWIKGRLHAYYWIFTNANKLICKRQYIQKYVRKVEDSEIMKHMIKTSVWDLVILAINVRKFGFLKARMLYFNNGLANKT